MQTPWLQPIVDTTSARNACGALTALLLALILSGCAGQVSRPVEESARDTSRRFDGVWQATAQAAPRRQNVAQWVFKCGDMQTRFPLRIVDGAVSVAGQEGTEHTTYIDSQGRFRLEIPTGSEVSSSSLTALAIQQDEMTVIIQGSLAEEPPTGFLTYGIAQFGNSGCSTELDFEKRQAPMQ